MFGILSENFAKKYEMMPEQLQGVFDDAETADVISQVAAVNNLSGEQLEIITCLTGDVLAGFVNYSDFFKKLTDEFKFNAIVAQDVFKEIDRQIFLPVRDLLKQVYKPEGVEEKKVEKQGTADLLQKLGQPLKVVIEKPVEVVPPGAPSFGVAQDKSFGVIQDKEFIVSPAKPFGVIPSDSVQNKQSVNVIDLSQGPALTRTEASSKPVQGAPVVKPTFPLFKFGNFDSAKPTGSTEIKSGMIFGKEQTVKPILETTKPMEFSFGEMKPREERIISNVEIQGGVQAMKKNIEDRKPIEQKPGFFGKLNNIISPTKVNTQPVRVVNFSAPIPPPSVISKEEINPIKSEGMNTPFISVNSPLSKNVNPIEQKPVIPVAPVVPVAPVMPTVPIELPKVEPIKSEPVKPEIKEEVMPSVPPENVVNLKKLRF
jgi:hypothetical protein